MNLAAVLRPFSRVGKVIAVALAIAACVFITSSMKAGALTQTVSVPASSGDTEIRSAKATTNYGGVTTVTVSGNEPAGTGNDVYGLVKFPLTNVPAGVTVADVKLRLNVTNSSTQPYSAFALKRAWVENQATWRIWKAGTKWQTAGATGTDDRESTALFTITPNATGVQTYTLGAAAIAKVQAWINNPATNNGFILANSSNTDGFSFSSRETANSPALIVTYDDGIQSDTTPPETTIASGPSEGSTVTSSNVSFAFSSSESGSSFECSLDGSAFGSCSSPKSYSNLTDGSHTFSVRATDAARNSDATPASRTWTIDTAAPDTTINSGPSGTITVADAEFTFSSLEAGATFECSLDGEAYRSCTSPKSYTNLSEGSHTFEVRAKDEAGNVDATPASRTFSVEVPPPPPETTTPPPADTTPPETTIDSGPSGTISSSSATFEFSSSEAGSTFQCQLDPLESALASCTSPKAYSGLMAGTEYAFSVWATDAAGNTDATPATSTFTLLDTRTNVRAFGATGDGTSNDTAAFERAMAEAARVGGAVYVPAPGNYRIASVTPPNNTHLEVQAGAVLKKYGSANGPLFNIAGPNDTTFVNNVRIEGVGGTFTMDLNDAGQETIGIRYRNVRGFSLRNMVCIQNNDNPTQEAPSSRRPCISFLPRSAEPVNGTYNHPIDGELSNVHSKKSPYGWGLTQISGGENLRFFNISSEGGVPLRVENYSAGWTPMKNIFADGVTCKNGHDAVHWNPHGATHPGPITVKNVVADSCESAMSIAGDGSYGPNASVDGVKVIPGNQAQVRDPAKTTYVGAWIIGPSKWCIDNNDPLGYTIGLSNVDCGVNETLVALQS